VAVAGTAWAFAADTGEQTKTLKWTAVDFMRILELSRVSFRGQIMNLMDGKTVIVTGPTSGIGREIARGLAGLGARLVLACRDIAAGTALAKEFAKIPTVG
jgi:FlaA1/EpsC-like NDP-sugar epimerase